MKHVLIVDDHPLIRRGIRQLLTEAGGRWTIAEAADGAAAEAHVRSNPCDLVLLDVGLPDRDGFSVLEALLLRRPGLAVLILSASLEPEFAVRALRAGARGYITKDTLGDELLRAIDRVAAGGTHVTGALAARLAEVLAHPDAEAPHQRLSPREQQVFIELARGRVNKEIAAAMGVSEKTISTYRARIIEKTGLATPVEMARYAWEKRLLT